MLRAFAALVVSIGLWYALRGGYDRVLVRTSAEVLSWFAKVPPEKLILEHEGRYFLDSQLSTESGRPLLYRLQEPYTVHWNWVLFFWAAGLIPFPRWRRVWWAVLGGALALFVTHVAYFTLAVFGQVAKVYEDRGLGFIDPGWIRVIAYAVQSWSVLLDKIVPFLLAAPALWLSRRPERPRRAPERSTYVGGRKVGRNEPCPCGSGRKFKRCCG